MVLELDTSKLQPDADLSDITNRALEIVRNRVDEFGVSEPVIQKAGDRRIIVELAGIDDIERARQIVLKAGRCWSSKMVRPGTEVRRLLERMDQEIARRAGVEPSKADANEDLEVKPEAAAKSGTRSRGRANRRRHERGCGYERRHGGLSVDGPGKGGAARVDGRGRAGDRRPSPQLAGVGHPAVREDRGTTSSRSSTRMIMNALRVTWPGSRTPPHHSRRRQSVVLGRRYHARPPDRRKRSLPVSPELPGGADRPGDRERAPAARRVVEHRGNFPGGLRPHAGRSAAVQSYHGRQRQEAHKAIVLDSRVKSAPEIKTRFAAEAPASPADSLRKRRGTAGARAHARALPVRS